MSRELMKKNGITREFLQDVRRVYHAIVCRCWRKDKKGINQLEIPCPSKESPILRKMFEEVSPEMVISHSGRLPYYANSPLGLAIIHKLEELRKFRVISDFEGSKIDISWEHFSSSGSNH